jgi:hypothetical protein
MKAVKVDGPHARRAGAAIVDMLMKHWRKEARAVFGKRKDLRGAVDTIAEEIRLRIGRPGSMPEDELLPLLTAFEASLSPAQLREFRVVDEAMLSLSYAYQDASFLLGVAAASVAGRPEGHRGEARTGEVIDFETVRLERIADRVYRVPLAGDYMAIVRGAQALSATDR